MKKTMLFSMEIVMKRFQKRKRKRKQRLDDEDLEVIEDALGVKVARPELERFKRIKKKRKKKMKEKKHNN